MLYKPGPLRSSAVRRSDGETRDLKSICDHLEKELERKDQRNDNLSKELLSLRATLANQQREQRLITATFDKLNYERSVNIADCAKFRDQIAKLEGHIDRLSDSQLLLDHIDKQQHVADTMQCKLDKFRISAVAKDETVNALEKELDTLHRSFDIQDRYESQYCVGSSGSANVIQAERDKIKSLYYELGKRQSDAHSLTLSLADKSVEMNSMKNSLKEAVNCQDQTKKQQVDLQTQIHDLEKSNANLREEVARCQDKISNLNDLQSRLNGQIEDISSRLSETKSSSKATITEKEKLIFELSSLLYSSQLEVGSANERFEELKQSLTHLQNATELNEQRSASNLNEAIGERKLLAVQLKDAEMLKPQLIMVKKNLTDIIQESNWKDQKMQAMEKNAMQDVAEARLIAEELHKELAVVQRNAEESQNRGHGLETERTHALRTLQSTLQAAKSLTAKLRDEKDLRIAAEERALKAERLADSLQRAKDHVSSAVLDALHREKSKSFRLENVIKEIGTNKGDDVINSRASTLSHAGHSSDTRTVYHLQEEKEIRVAHSRSSMPGAVDRAVPMLAGLNQSTSSSNSSEQCSSRTEHTTPNRFNSSASSGTEPSPLPPPLPIPIPLGGSQRGEGEIDDYRSSSAPYFSQSCPSHAVSSIAIPATCATRDQDTKPVARRELRLDAMSFDSPSRTVVDGLTRLRDHLREIEEGAPSPLHQSRSVSLSQSVVTNDSSYHHCAAKAEEHDSHGDTSSLEADPDCWRASATSNSLIDSNWLHFNVHSSIHGDSYKNEGARGADRQCENSVIQPVSHTASKSDTAAQIIRDREEIREQFSVFEGHTYLPKASPVTSMAVGLPSSSPGYTRDSYGYCEVSDEDTSLSLFDLAR